MAPGIYGNRVLLGLAELLRHNRPPAEIVNWYANQDADKAGAFRGTQRNDPCP